VLLGSCCRGWMAEVQMHDFCCIYLLQVSGLGGQRLPAAADVQTALLLGVAEAAAKAKLAAEILAFNVSRWEQSSSGCVCCDPDTHRKGCVPCSSGPLKHT
jgi:hypothetical protein